MCFQNNWKMYAKIKKISLESSVKTKRKSFNKHQTYKSCLFSKSFVKELNLLCSVRSRTSSILNIRWLIKTKTWAFCGISIVDCKLLIFFILLILQKEESPDLFKRADLQNYLIWPFTCEDNVNWQIRLNKVPTATWQRGACAPTDGGIGNE